MKYAVHLQHWHMFWFKLHKYKLFYPLEVVGRGSETQLQVGKSNGGKLYNVVA